MLLSLKILLFEFTFPYPMSNIGELLFMKISDINDFSDKLDIFLRSLDEEFVT